MTDEVLKEISRILRALVLNSGLYLTKKWLPVSYVNLIGASAYGMLQALVGELVGLKLLEARAALSYFPPKGHVSGGHTIDEFLSHAWDAHARKVIADWNVRRGVQFSRDVLDKARNGLLEAQISRSIRYRKRTVEDYSE